MSKLLSRLYPPARVAMYSPTGLCICRGEQRIAKKHIALDPFNTSENTGKKDGMDTPSSFFGEYPVDGIPHPPFVFPFSSFLFLSYASFFLSHDIL